MPLIQPLRLTDGETEAQIVQRAGLRAEGNIQAQPCISRPAPPWREPRVFSQLPGLTDRAAEALPATLRGGGEGAHTATGLWQPPPAPLKSSRRSALCCLPLQRLLLQIGIEEAPGLESRPWRGRQARGTGGPTWPRRCAGGWPGAGGALEDEWQPRGSPVLTDRFWFYFQQDPAEAPPCH